MSRRTPTNQATVFSLGHVLVVVSALALTACEEDAKGFRPKCLAYEDYSEPALTCEDVCVTTCGVCEPQFEMEDRVGTRYADSLCEGPATTFEPDAGEFIENCEEPIFEIPPEGDAYFTCCCYSDLVPPNPSELD